MAKLGRPAQQNLGRFIAEGRRRAAIKAAQRQASVTSRRSSLIRRADDIQVPPESAPPQQTEQIIQSMFRSGSRNRDKRRADRERNDRKIGSTVRAFCSRISSRVTVATEKHAPSTNVFRRLGKNIAIVRDRLAGRVAGSLRDLIRSVRNLGNSISVTTSSLLVNLAEMLCRMAVLSVFALVAGGLLIIRSAFVLPIRVMVLAASSAIEAGARCYLHIRRLLTIAVHRISVIYRKISADSRKRVQAILDHVTPRFLRQTVVGLYAVIAISASVMLAVEVWNGLPERPGRENIAQYRSEPVSGRVEEPLSQRIGRSAKSTQPPLQAGPDTRLQKEPEAGRVHAVKLRLPDPPARDKGAVTVSVPVDITAPASPEAPMVLPRAKPERPTWMVNAASYGATPTGPRIAIIIDDLGMDRAGSRRAVDLPAAVTLAILPYAPGASALARQARLEGHELLVHLPMEPDSTRNPGPGALLTTLEIEALKQRIAWNLNRFDGFVGINNHMGSRFTRSDTAMKHVMGELKRRGLMFLDSRTTADTVGARLAARSGVPFVERDIFLDNERDRASVEGQLKKVEKLAHRQGHAIAIGHPYDVTIDALMDWYPTLGEKGLALVPLTSLLHKDAASPSRLASAAQP